MSEQAQGPLEVGGIWCGLCTRKGAFITCMWRAGNINSHIICSSL